MIALSTDRSFSRPIEYLFQRLIRVVTKIDVIWLHQSCGAGCVFMVFMRVSAARLLDINFTMNRIHIGPDIGLDRKTYTAMF